MWIKIDEEKSVELVQQIKVVKTFGGFTSQQILEEGIKAIVDTKEFKEKLESIKTRLGL